MPTINQKNDPHDISYMKEIIDEIRSGQEKVIKSNEKVSETNESITQSNKKVSENNENIAKKSIKTVNDISKSNKNSIEKLVEKTGSMSKNKEIENLFAKTDRLLNSSNINEKDVLKLIEEAKKVFAKNGLVDEDMVREYFDEILGVIDDNFEESNKIREKAYQIWNLNTTNELKGIFSDVKGTITSHIRDVLGPAAGLFDFLQSTMASTFRIIGNLGSDIKSVFGFGNEDEKETKSERKRNKLLTKISDSMHSLVESGERMLGLEKKRDKARAREIPEKKKGIWGWIIAAAALLAGILFRYAKDLTKALKFLLSPFKFFGKAFKKLFTSLKLSAIGKKFTSLFGKGGKIGKFFESIIDSIKSSKLILIIKDKFSKISKGFQTLKEGKIFTMFSSIFGKEGKIGKLFISISQGLKNIRIDNIIKKLSEGIMKVFKPLANFKGGFIGEWIAKWFGRGMLIGKILLPFEMAYKAISGIFSADGIRDKILAASAGILDPILKIPEMIGNALLWLSRKFFGPDLFKDIKFDFGTEKIIESVNSLTKWLETNVTDKLFEFFNETLPSLWEGIMAWFDNIGENIKNFTKNLLGIKDPVKEDWVPLRLQNKTLDEMKAEGLLNSPEKTSTNIQALEDNKVELSKVKYAQIEKEKAEKKKRDEELLKSNKEAAKSNESVINQINTYNNVV